MNAELSVVEKLSGFAEGKLTCVPWGKHKILAIKSIIYITSSSSIFGYWTQFCIVRNILVDYRAG